MVIIVTSSEDFVKKKIKWPGYLEIEVSRPNNETIILALPGSTESLPLIPAYTSEFNIDWRISSGLILRRVRNIIGAANPE